jgi:hypothetical protein
VFDRICAGLVGFMLTTQTIGNGTIVPRPGTTRSFPNDLRPN